MCYEKLVMVRVAILSFAQVSLPFREWTGYIIVMVNGIKVVIKAIMISMVPHFNLKS